MKMILSYRTSTSCRNIAIGFAALTVLMFPVFVWVILTSAHLVPTYFERHALDQVALVIVVIGLSITLATGSIYFFIPPLAEVESVEVLDNHVVVKRSAMSSVAFVRGTKFVVKKILIPNYTEDKSRKNFPAYLYISWPKFFVLSERIEGYDELNKMLQDDAG